MAMTEDEISKRFGDKLEQTEEGDMPSVVAKVASALIHYLTLHDRTPHYIFIIHLRTGPLRLHQEEGARGEARGRLQLVTATRLGKVNPMLA